MNSSFAPLGPRTRNSLITIPEAFADASPPGRPLGRILTPPEDREAESEPRETTGIVGTVGTPISPTSCADGADGAGGCGAWRTTLSGVRTIVSGVVTRLAFF